MSSSLTTISPANSLGTDLIWWRAAPGQRALVSVVWNPTSLFADSIHIEARISNAKGRVRASWHQPLAVDQPLLIDSHAHGEWQAAGPTEGLLALFACTEGKPSRDASELFHRFYPVVDWWEEGRHLGTLHSDQNVIHRDRQAVSGITEIVVREASNESNALVILNGEVEQAAAALSVQVKNSKGEFMSAVWDQAMRPFTVNCIPLSSLFDDIDGFCGEGQLQVEAEFQSRGVFTRPYVKTTGAARGIFHGDNVATWGALHPVLHAMVGGEVNPIAVIQDADTRTFINILHSHEGHELPVPNDVRLFDLEGACVFECPAKISALRKELVRIDVSALLPDASQPFKGHISLNFSTAENLPVPLHLQALAEYRRADTVARVMCWSDQFNSNIRMAKRDRQPNPTRWRSYFRLLENAELVTEAWITNSGHGGYRRSAKVEATLILSDGESRTLEMEIAPFATRILVLDNFASGGYPQDCDERMGMLWLESESDLAIMGFTRHLQQPGIAAEHFMSLMSLNEGSLLAPAGS